MRQSVEKGHGNQSRIRSYFKFIPKQIETYVEADWSPRYLLAMIILFLYKFKTAS